MGRAVFYFLKSCFFFLLLSLVLSFSFEYVQTLSDLSLNNYIKQTCISCEQPEPTYKSLVLFSQERLSPEVLGLYLPFSMAAPNPLLLAPL